MGSGKKNTGRIKHKVYQLCCPLKIFLILMPAVHVLIFACLNFRGFLILGLFTKLKIREFSFFFSSAIIIIIFVTFFNLSSLQNSRKLKSPNITRSTVYQMTAQFLFLEFYNRYTLWCINVKLMLRWLIC